MVKLEVVGLTLAAILFVSLGCGCIGDAPDIKGADIEIYLDGVLVNTFVRELPVGLLYSEQAYAEGVHNLLIDGSAVELVTVIGNTVSIYLISGEPAPMPTPEPVPEPEPEPVMFEYFVKIYLDGTLIASRTDEVESGTIKSYLKKLDREFGVGNNVLYVDVTRSGRTIKVNIVSIPEPTPEPTYQLLIFLDGELDEDMGTGWSLDECLDAVDEIRAMDDYKVAIWDMKIIGYFRIFVETVKVEEVIPANYYNQGDTAIPNWITTELEFTAWFESTEWVDSYEANGWDCSQMSAFMEWQLENEGFDAVIACDETHAWVLTDINGDGQYIALECTGRYVVWIDSLYPDTDYYNPSEGYCEDIYELVQKYGLDDWNWWN